MSTPAPPPSRLKSFAGVLAALAPVLALLATATVVLFVPGARTAVFPRDGGTWVLVVAGVVCAVEATVLVWRGSHGGDLMPFKLLAFAAGPWAAGIMIALLRVGDSPATVGHAEGARLIGAVLSSGLLAAVGLSLALDAYAASALPPHPGRAVVGMASVLPLAVFALATAVSAGFGIAGVAASLLPLGMLLVVGLSAATGDAKPAWTVAVPVALGLAFITAGSVVGAAEAVRTLNLAASMTEPPREERDAPGAE